MRKWSDALDANIPPMRIGVPGAASTLPFSRHHAAIFVSIALIVGLLSNYGAKYMLLLPYLGAVWVFTNYSLEDCVGFLKANLRLFLIAALLGIYGAVAIAYHAEDLRIRAYGALLIYPLFVAIVLGQFARMRREEIERVFFWLILLIFLVPIAVQVFSLNFLGHHIELHSLISKYRAGGTYIVLGGDVIRRASGFEQEPAYFGAVCIYLFLSCVFLTGRVNKAVLLVSALSILLSISSAAIGVFAAILCMLKLKQIADAKSYFSARSILGALAVFALLALAVAFIYWREASPGNYNALVSRMSIFPFLEGRSALQHLIGHGLFISDKASPVPFHYRANGSLLQLYFSLGIIGFLVFMGLLAFNLKFSASGMLSLGILMTALFLIRDYLVFSWWLMIGSFVTAPKNYPDRPRPRVTAGCSSSPTIRAPAPR